MTNNGANINFELSEDALMLDEMVVVGFGTKRKRDVTSSISTVKGDEMQDVHSDNFTKAIQGRSPGVLAMGSNGMAGGAISMRIRGTSSIMTSSEPLYVVDGVPIITGNITDNGKFADGTDALSQINSDDIESIEILKDASAAAIYGSRAANGVVLITTKQGKAGTTKFDFGYSTGTMSETNRPKYLTAEEYLKYSKISYMHRELYDPVTRMVDTSLAGITAAENAFWSDLPFNLTREIAENTNTDWIDEMLRTGSIQNVNLSASGGNEKTTYFLGGSYRDEKGILLGNDYTKVSGRVNLRHVHNKYFTVGANVSLTNTKNYRVPTSWAGGLGTAQSRSLPIMPVYDSLGAYYMPRSGVNVVAFNEDFDYVANTNSVLANTFGEIHFNDYLFFRSDFGLNQMFLTEETYTGTITRELAEANLRKYDVTAMNLSNTLNFNKSFGSSKINGMLGMETLSSKGVGSWVSGTEFSTDDLTMPGDASRTNGGTWLDRNNGFVSYFARAAYNLSDKYLFSGSIRYDGSSKFGPDNQYGFFPAVSLGWIISEENFWKSDIFNYLKFRASYGIQGNAELPDFEWFGSYYATSYNGQAGIGLKRIENLNLGWEKSAQRDFGFDYGILDGRISGAVDYYFKNTTDMIMPVNIPQTAGSNSVTLNVGEMNNWGWEFMITSRNIVTNKFKWTTDFNISSNKNKIIHIEPKMISGETFGNNFAVEGYSIGQWRLVEWAGVANEYMQIDVFLDPDDAERTTIEILPGEEIFYDFNGDITNEFNFDRDAKVVGNPYPKVYGGINNTFEYGNFDFSFFFTYALGQDVYRDDGKFLEGGFDGNWNQTDVAMQAWTPANPEDPRELWTPLFETDIPMAYWQQDNRNYNSTRYLNDASYLRLKTIRLGYTMPNELTKKYGMTNVRFYVAGQNLWTLTNYPGWDPEVNRDSSGNRTRGVTYLSPPQVKTITFGVNLNF